MPHFTAHTLLDIPAYWVLFWNSVYVLSPPREAINSPKYNKFLDLVSYYGSLNIRSLLMKGVYQAAPSEAPPVPKREDAPAVETKDK